MSRSQANPAHLAHYRMHEARKDETRTMVSVVAVLFTFAAGMLCLILIVFDGSTANADPLGQGEPDLTEQGARALRDCESTNNYTINTGNGYFGAYQFNQVTWANTLAWMDRAAFQYPTRWADWADSLPSQAPPDVQDAAATWLWNNDPEHSPPGELEANRTGRRRWPICQHAALAAMQGSAPIPSFAGSLRGQ